MSPAATESFAPDDLIAEADQLEAGCRFLDAARALEAIPVDEREPMVEVRIVRLRHRAYAELPAGVPDDDPGEPPDLFHGATSTPEVAGPDLTVEVLRSALWHHGCLIVRGLLAPGDCEQLRHEIDRSYATYDDRGPFKPPEVTAPWFAALEVEPGFEPLDPLGTAFLRSGGGVYAPQAPRAFLHYREALADAGLLDVVAAHLGGVPVLSVNKTVLRRIGGGAQPTWHQDGCYLGVEMKAVNLWVALSRCGADTEVMGLDILPMRRRELRPPAGTHNAVDERAIAQEIVEGYAVESGRPIVRPLFLPGDGILFDQFFLHRSDTRALPTERYAVESWFFRRADFPSHMIPVVAG